MKTKVQMLIFIFYQIFIVVVEISERLIKLFENVYAHCSYVFRTKTNMALVNFEDRIKTSCHSNVRRYYKYLSCPK